MTRVTFNPEVLKELYVHESEENLAAYEKYIVRQAIHFGIRLDINEEYPAIFQTNSVAGMNFLGNQVLQFGDWLDTN